VDGRPVTELTYVEGTGINKVYTIHSPVEVSGYAGNYHTANFYTVGLHGHTFQGITSDLPYAMDPLGDRNGTPIWNKPYGSPAQEAYEFRCLDRAYEVINRIRVYIREWNTQREFIAYDDSNGASGDPDTVGDETMGDCEYGVPGDLRACNDDGDWDDIVGAYPYGTAANRPLRFPQERPRASEGS